MPIFASATVEGFFDTTLGYATLPADAVEINAQLHGELLAGQASGQLIDWSGPLPALVAAPLPSIEALAAAKRTEIHVEAMRRRDALIPEYPLHERETWDQQSMEAKAKAADPAAPTPLLSAMALARGITVAGLAAKVTAKAAAFAAAGGSIIGAQQALEDQLQTALDAYAGGSADEPTTRMEIAAIDPADPAAWPA